MGAVRPQTPHRSPRQAFGGNAGKAGPWPADEREAGGVRADSYKPARYVQHNDQNFTQAASSHQGICVRFGEIGSRSFQDVVG